MVLVMFVAFCVTRCIDIVIVSEDATPIIIPLLPVIIAIIIIPVCIAVVVITIVVDQHRTVGSSGTIVIHEVG